MPALIKFLPDNIGSDLERTGGIQNDCLAGNRCRAHKNGKIRYSFRADDAGFESRPVFHCQKRVNNGIERKVNNPSC